MRNDCSVFTSDEEVERLPIMYPPFLVDATRQEICRIEGIDYQAHDRSKSYM